MVYIFFKTEAMRNKSVNWNLHAVSLKFPYLFTLYVNEILFENFSDILFDKFIILCYEFKEMDRKF